MSTATRAQDIVQVPNLLKSGDKVGIVSPSSWIRRREIEKGIILLQKWGFDVRIGQYALLRHKYMAGTDQERVGDLHKMFQDPEVKAIFCTRGGYGSLRLLGHLDYGLIRENPKIFMGFSDLTALLLAIYKEAKVMVFHGPVLKTKGIGKPLEEAILYLRSPQSIEIPLSKNLILRGGAFEGRLLGGNLTVISHMVGTGFLPELKGAVLFLEDVAERPYKIDRALTHLRLSGVLEGVSGLLLGDFVGCGPKREIAEIFKELAEHLVIPCVMGLPVGHGRRNMVIPIGGFCRLEGRTLKINPWNQN